MKKEDVSLKKTDLLITIVKVETDNGIIGCGYTYSDGYGGYATKNLLQHDISEIVLGQDPTNVKAIVNGLFWELRKIGRSGVTSLRISFSSSV